MASSDMVGRWDRWNAMHDRGPYGDTQTYALGADWLQGCALVEDWGCGRGWMATLVPPERYRGVDGSSPFAEVEADLADYRSVTPGLFMRHVLEHNYRWRTILANAIASFTERMAVVLFTPLVAETRQIDFVADPGVPDLAFALEDLTGPIGQVADWSHTTVASETAYGQETVIFAERR